MPIIAIFDLQKFTGLADKMKIIYSTLLPAKGFRAINLFGIVFARKDQPALDEHIINHESIHTRQMLELGVIGFYLWYVVEWIIRWIQYKDRYQGYRNIGFEREAYANDNDFSYLEKRRTFNFLGYLKNLA